MTQFAQYPEIISKEVVQQLHFPVSDVLATPDARNLRRYSAERATTLGNGYHGKVDIYFKTADGETKRVQTTVWANDAEYITLKSGAFLPMRSVLGIDFL
ncbi:hypothetical protein FY528_13990 [Hymenobacter lutimineralis]|uniref:Uncharacterized protein n=1 Tax=Hymenobacter lutimineralis TaxID=2606448 RepID=A0A5D6UW90_9BACT|nr:hypothetical protein [Hymenobacter lutimineralis]TYZ07803.1 hypothetical protein FY528_13990 [Hymenobacter lutimineralis]